jgi:hypothetical protein
VYVEADGALSLGDVDRRCDSLLHRVQCEFDASRASRALNYCPLLPKFLEWVSGSSTYGSCQFQTHAPLAERPIRCWTWGCDCTPQWQNRKYRPTKQGSGKTALISINPVSGRDYRRRHPKR